MAEINGRKAEIEEEGRSSIYFPEYYHTEGDFVLAKPIADLASFRTIVQSVIGTTPFGCLTNMTPSGGSWSEQARPLAGV